LIGRFDLSNSTNEPEKVRNTGDYFQAGALVQYELSAKSKINIGWYYAKGTNNKLWDAHGIVEKNPDAIGRGVFQFGFSQSF